MGRFCPLNGVRPTQSLARDLIKMTRKQIRLALSVLFCVALIVTFFPIFYATYRNIERNTQLDAFGKLSKGIVTGHRRALHPYKSCQFEALVQYQVEDRAYLTVVGGCRPNVTDLPSGTTVNVRFLPTSPSVSAIELPGGVPGVSRVLWGALVFLSSVLAIAIFFVIREAKRLRVRSQQ